LGGLQPALSSPIATVEKPRRLEWLFVILVPLWLLGLNLPPMLNVGQQRETLQLVTLAWLAIPCLIVGTNTFAYAGVFRGSLPVRIATLVLVIAISASAALSVDPALSFGYAAVMVLGFGCCAGIWSCINSRMEQALIGYAVLGSAFSAYVYLEGVRIQGRLIFEAGHPNFLALVCFGSLACCMSIPNPLLRFGLAGINLMVIIETQARSSLVAAVIAIAAHTTLSYASAWKRTRLPILIPIGTVLLFSALGMIYWREVSKGFTALLFLDDPNRGLGTGFTGRTQAWQEAYEIFKANPFFGIGFRTHDRYMSSLPSAHNGYFSMLADTGAIGLLLALTLIGICFQRLLRMVRTGDRTAIVGFSLVSGYLFVAVFERYLINFGSSTSVLMWVFLLMPRWQRPGVRVESKARTEVQTT